MFSRIWSFIASAATVLIISVLPSAASTLLLDVDGPTGGQVLLGPNHGYYAAAATFTPNQDIYDATLGMTIHCFSCAGTVYLFDREPAPNVPVIARLDQVDFDNTLITVADLDLNQIITKNVRVSDLILTLLAGTTYTLVLEITQGAASWHASFAATWDAAYITPGVNYTSVDANNNFIIEAPFQDLTTFSDPVFNPLKYEIYGSLSQASDPVTSVPLPAGLALSSVGLACLAFFRRKRA